MKGSSQVTGSYWNGDGKYQKMANLLKREIEVSKENDDIYLKAYSDVTQIYYDVYNNDGINLVKFLEVEVGYDEDLKEPIYDLENDYSKLEESMATIWKTVDNKEWMMKYWDDSSLYHKLLVENDEGIYINMEKLVDEVIEKIAEQRNISL